MVYINSRCVKDKLRVRLGSCLPVTPVSKGRNDKATCVAQVFVGIGDSGGDHSHLHEVVLEVIAQLTDPREVEWAPSLLLVERGDDVTCCQDINRLD